ncbi:MBL fold metallo-hydrolase, partial [Erwinia amylovora]|uniref:MBL fold metallo-hydrolase n=1 Tax=Erwinia amylovora TaxID=552 RepID=UPI0020BF4E28
HWNGGLVHHAIQLAQPFSVAVCPALRFTAIHILSNAPPYSPYRGRPLPGHNIALMIEYTASGSKLLYAPGLGETDAQLLDLMSQADCLLVDCTLW